MEKHFFIFRHGQTDYNLEERLQGQSLDISLNEIGITQAKTVADSLSSIVLDAVYSSSLKRAYETAEIVSEYNDIPHIVDDRIKEINFGVLEGMTREEIKQKHPDEFEKWHDVNNFDYNFNNGENREEVMKRIDDFFSDMIDNDFVNIAISTHGAFLKRFLLKIGKSVDKVENCHIYHLINENGKWK